jgi:hypothetical protein
MTADGCNVFQPEHKIRALELNPTIEPCFVKFKEDQLKRDGWHVPVDKVVASFKESGVIADATQTKELHLLLSADHGQQAWRAALTLLVIGARSQKKECSHCLHELSER